MSLQALQQALDSFQGGSLDATGFCRIARTQSLPPELPARYGEVLGNLLDRLEAGAMFGGESCSFSQDDLVASFQMWIDKAQERLAQ